MLLQIARATEENQRSREQIVIFKVYPHGKFLNRNGNSYRNQGLSQIEALPPLPDDEQRQHSVSEQIPETYSPISPNADRNLIKPLGFCDQEFRLSVSHENNNVMWDLSEFAKAGKLLKNPAMAVDFYDEYEMRKVYSLIYDVFRCKLW